MSTKKDRFSGDYYDVPKTSGHFSTGGTSSKKAKTETSNTKADKEALSLGRITTSLALAPIIIDEDNTGSNIEFTRIFYDRFKMFIGQIMYPGKTVKEIEKIEAGELPMDVVPYLSSYDVIFGYVGDATCDEYPLQHTDPLHGKEFYSWIKKMTLEGGGGYGTCESFELAALRALRYFRLPNAISPFYFLPCDELPYPQISNAEVIKHLDRNYDEKLITKDVYEQLFRKFKGNVYILVNPYKGRDEHGIERYPDVTRKVINGWKNVIPPKYHDHIIKLRLEKAVVDVMLGIIARVTGARDKAGYVADMISREQTPDRVDMVNDMLGFLDNINVTADGLPENEDEAVSVGAKRI